MLKCHEKVDIIPEGFSGYVKGKIRKPYIKNAIMLLFVAFTFQGSVILLMLYTLFSAEINFADYFLYIVVLLFFYILVPKLPLSLYCAHAIYKKKSIILWASLFSYIISQNKSYIMKTSCLRSFNI